MRGLEDGRVPRRKQRFVVVWVALGIIGALSYLAVEFWPQDFGKDVEETIKAGPKGNFKIKTSVGEVVSVCDGHVRLYLTPTGGVTALEDDRCIASET